MDDLIAARSQMAVSLGFHIIFACIGMVMPFFMAVSHYKWLKTGDETWLKLTKAWMRGVAIFFVTGAVSGTVLSFELGLLWPTFMEHAGPIFGMPFSLEGTAFFLEAIAIGFYLYGWNRLKPWVHWSMGLAVGVMGVTSGILVVAANAWMNSPAGFEYVNGQYTNIDPIAAMFNDAWFSQSLHMILAAFAATGFAVAGLHAWRLLRGHQPEFHRRAFKIAAIFGFVAALLQPISGDISAKDVAKRQPAKLAAMEAHFHTETAAGLLIGGIPDPESQTVRYGIRIPGMLSFLAHGDFNSEVKGLDQIPADEHPPVVVTHFAFQIMVGAGFAMMGLALLYFLFNRTRRKALDRKLFLRVMALATPLGYIALEAGWTVTEVGRQPWIMYGYMRTSEALTPMPGIAVSFWMFTALYLALSFLVAFLLLRQIRAIEQAPDSLSLNH